VFNTGAPSMRSFAPSWPLNTFIGHPPRLSATLVAGPDRGLDNANCRLASCSVTPVFARLRLYRRDDPLVPTLQAGAKWPHPAVGRAGKLRKNVVAIVVIAHAGEPVDLG
jgi:hypothetical protein